MGDKLPSEIELSEAFQVSRPVVREAIRYLELTGMVKVKQGATGGAFISEFNSRVLQDNMRDLLIARKVSVSQLTELRMHVEPEVARLAAMRRTDKDLQEMKQSVSRSSQDLTGEDYVKNNANFHRIVGRASQNLLYSVVQDCIMDITEEFIGTIKSVQLVLHDPSEHTEIYKAILDREGDLAAAITREHTIKIGNQMQQLEKLYLEMIQEKMEGAR